MATFKSSTEAAPADQTGGRKFTEPALRSERMVAIKYRSPSVRSEMLVGTVLGCTPNAPLCPSSGTCCAGVCNKGCH